MLLLSLGVPLLFLGLGPTFLDPDEGLYADIAGRMVASGDLVVPRFNGLPYLEKPPLYFWLSAAALAAGLPAEGALRGISALSALASALLTWRIGRRLWGPEAGVLGGVAFLTMAGVALYVRKASTDLLFVACLALAVWGFLRDAERPAARRRFLFLYLGAALGLLTKGLIGLLFPLSIVALSGLLVSRPVLGRLNFGRGLALFGVVALPWHVAAAVREPDLFWFYLVDNQVLRFLDVRRVVEDDLPVGTLAFLLLTFVWLFPWSVFLLARSGGGVAPGARWRAVPVIWVLTVIAFFALSRSKLEYYALPAFPAIALLAGAAWASGRDVGRWLWIGLAGVGTVGALAIWAGAHLTPEQALRGLAELNVYYRILLAQGGPFPFASAQPVGGLLQALGVVLIAGWGLAALAWARRWRRAAFAALAGLAVVIGALIVQLLSFVEPHHSTRAVAADVVDRAGADDVLVHEGSLEYSAALPFYTGRRVVVLNGARGDLELASRRPEAREWFLDTTTFGRLWAGERRVFLVTRDSGQRSALRALPPGTVHQLAHFGGRALYSNQRGP